MSLELEVQLLRPDGRLPTQAYPGDGAFDLYAAEPARLEPGARAVVATGIAVAIPDGYAGLVVPRSGLAAHHGLTVVNGPGLIDAGYRGEVRVVLLNTDRERAFTVSPGERVAQLMLVAVPAVSLRQVARLPEGSRGEGGFGSSGR